VWERNLMPRVTPFILSILSILSRNRSCNGTDRDDA
jgi:hypothetical protein